MKKLLAENDRLKKEIDAAQKQILTLKSEATRKDQEIARLRTEITTFQGEIAILRQQSGTYQTQVADLTLQLKNYKKRNLPTCRLKWFRKTRYFGRSSCGNCGANIVSNRLATS